MSRLAAWALSAVCLTGCSDEGPIYSVKNDLFDWVTAATALDERSDRAPEIKDQTVFFHLRPGDRASALQTGEDWRRGNALLIGFDLRLDHVNLGSEKIDLSRFFRKGSPATELFSVQLDRKRGVTVMGRQCIAPQDLGDWHRVEMRVRLHDNDGGFLEVFCDRKPIWARQNLRTTFPPLCRRATGCTEVAPHPMRFEWNVGVMSDRRVSRHVRVQMRRLHHRQLLYIPNRPGTL